MTLMLLPRICVFQDLVGKNAILHKKVVVDLIFFCLLSRHRKKECILATLFGSSVYTENVIELFPSFSSSLPSGTCWSTLSWCARSPTLASRARSCRATWTAPTPPGRRFNKKKFCLKHHFINYREEIYSLQILLRRTQAGPGRTGKQEQEEISPNHVQRINLPSVYHS